MPPEHRPVCILLAALSACSAEPPRGALELSPATVDFGRVLLGTGVEAAVQISNPSLTAVSLDVPESASDAAFAYELPTRTLSPGRSTTLLVRYRPDRRGTEAATLRLGAPGAAPETLTILAEARQDGLRIAPDRIDFGRRALDAPTATVATLFNDTDHPLELFQRRDPLLARCDLALTSPYCVELDGEVGHAGRFVIPPRASRGLFVRLDPLRVGVVRGDLAYAACEAAPCAVATTITATIVAQPLSCPGALDFGVRNPGTCQTREVTCRNEAAHELRVLAWRPTSTPRTDLDFTVPASGTVELGPGDRWSVPIEYCPSGVDAHRGALEIVTDRAEASEVQVRLEGQGGGADVRVAPVALDFSEVARLAPAYASLRIDNVGVARLEITAVEVPEALTAPGLGPTVLAPGASLSVPLELRLDGPGPMQGSLRLHTNDPDTPVLEVPVRADGVDLPSCDFEVRRRWLDFGPKELLRAWPDTFELRNVGAHDCIVNGLDLLPGGAAAFSLPEGPVLGRRLRPGQALHVPVRFHPSAAGLHTSALQVGLSSSEQPRLRIDLTGEGVEGGPWISPRIVELGAPRLGCAAASALVEVHHRGAVAGRIDRVGIDGLGPSAFSVRGAPALPITLAPGASAAFEVVFAPDVVGEQVSAIEIEGDLHGAQTTYSVPVRAVVPASGRHEDRFVQLSLRKADVLFVVDMTGSMGEEQAALARSAERFFSVARALGVDFQVAVTSAWASVDQGRLFHAARPRGGPFTGPLTRRIIRSSTAPDPATVLGDNLLARSPAGGEETGAWAAYLALSPPNLLEHNRGFLRSDAHLGLIFVSDEPDRTPQSVGAPWTDFETYARYLRSLGGPGQVSASTIVGPRPAGCEGPEGRADRGDGYLELVDRLGGATASICAADWGATLETVAEAALGVRRRFFLRRPAVPGSVEVEVDGAFVPEIGAGGQRSWAFDPGLGAVTFTAFAVPPPGASVVLRYAEPCL